MVNPKLHGSFAIVNHCQRTKRDLPGVHAGRSLRLSVPCGPDIRGLHGAEQVPMHGRSSGNDIAMIQEVRVAVQVGDDPSCLLHQQGARRDVPGQQCKLEESIEKSRRDIGQVQRCCAGPTHVSATAPDLIEDSKISRCIGRCRIRQTRTDQGFDQP